MEHILPSVQLELGGKMRRLVFDFNAQAAFEEVTGVTVLSLFDKKGRLNVSSRFTRALLWAQLLHHDQHVRFDELGHMVDHPELSIPQVGKLITQENLREVNQKVAEALILFYKPSKKSEEGNSEEENPQSR